MMVHGPCGPVDPSASCMKENLYSKKFPKKFNNETYFDKNGYVYYRRRDTGVKIQKLGSHDVREVKDLLGGWSILGLPSFSECLLTELRNKEMMEEKSYNREELVEEVVTLVPRLNVDQKKIYDLIMDASAENQQEIIFVYSHGGTWKTFLWWTIINSLWSHGKMVLAVASSGIASLLLPSSHTTHSSFKLLLELTVESICGIKIRTRGRASISTGIFKYSSLLGFPTTRIRTKGWNTHNAFKNVNLQGEINNMYFVEYCARKGAPIRSPIGIGAGLEEYLAPMERPDKIPIGDRDGFGAWFANWVWGWMVAAPPHCHS
nr:DNA helicase [Tanacetum cinerariifolium]